MVKIVEKTKKEIDDEKRVKKLEEIAELTIPFKVSVLNPSGVAFGVFDYLTNAELFSVWPEKNQIILSNKKYFDVTKSVAEGYEKQTNSEWILKKNYTE